MATTTNYGWTTPDDTALVKDGASAIRTLGSSVDTTTKNLNPETTLGDIAYRSSSANVKTRLGIGTAGQVLTVVSGVPAWSTAASGGGKVLQVVNATYGTQVDSSSSTFADTNLTATITPTLASSKILVLVNQSGCGKETNNTSAGIKLLRGATDLITIDPTAGTTASAVRVMVGSVSACYLDTPNTTSATTYKTQFNSNSNNATASVQFANAVSTITLMEIGV